MTNLKVGNIVMMNSVGRKSYYNHPKNPYDSMGVILSTTENHSEHKIKVKWDNGEWNLYRATELFVVKKYKSCNRINELT